jgi:hypothetical protein
MKRSCRLFTLMIGLLTLAISAFAQISPVPQLMNFQGRLTRPDGTPVADGDYSIRFSFWSAASGGTERWNQTINPVTVRNGTFAALLSGFPAGTFNTNLWLQLQIGADAPLAPRQQLVSVAYAMKADSVSDGAITSAGIVDGTITGADIANGTITTNKLAADALRPLAWSLNGNNGVTNGFLGTTDILPLDIRVNNRRAMRYSYAENTTFSYRSINILGGADSNEIGSGVVGATIAGGGIDSFTGIDSPNRVLNDFGTIGGGYSNTASGWYATIAGGIRNTANDIHATIGGGADNTADIHGTIAGGTNNTAGSWGAIGGGFDNIASGNIATVAGGHDNTASGFRAFIGGGFDNIASGSEASSVAGGGENTAAGRYAAIPGGHRNSAAGNYSFAAGRQARANQDGCFVWADSHNADFNSTGTNQFLIRASGGVGINTGAPAAALHLLGNSAPLAGLPAGNNGLLLGSNGTTSYKWIHSYGGPLVFNSQGNNVGIGITNPSFKLHVNGSVGGVGNYNNVSDARYKTNVQTFSNALDAILSLRGVRFDWKQSAFPEMKFAAGRQVGFIAQEVEEVLPELVTTDVRGYKSVAYANVVPVLVEAVKQQQKQITAKERRLHGLETENALLKAELEAVKAAIRQLQMQQAQR